MMTDNEFIWMAKRKTRLTGWLGIERLEATLRGIQEQMLPPTPLVFRALESLSPRDVKVIVLGQDPYPTIGKASGLAFGLSREYLDNGGQINSSIENIINELKNCGYTPPNLTLESWLAQGVLLINTYLTVRPDKPLSHAGIWDTKVEELLKRNIADVYEKDSQPVVLAWGRHAHTIALRAGFKHVVATSHPCKFSHARTSERLPAFTGSQCFLKVNQILYERGEEGIAWGS